MSWTYSGDPSSTPKDAVRFAIGDTIQNDPLLQDEEISYIVAQNPSIDDSAYAAAVAIVAKFSRLTDIMAGKEKIFYSQKVKQYQQLADKLWLNAGVVVIPYAGGVSAADKENMQNDKSIVQPSFKKGVFDNHRYI